MDYGRYGSFYVYVLENLDTTHPGVKKELKNKEISVRQNTFEIGQAVDMAGEQTYILYICLPEMIPILEKGKRYTEYVGLVLRKLFQSQCHQKYHRIASSKLPLDIQISNIKVTIESRV